MGLFDQVVVSILDQKWNDIEGIVTTANAGSAKKKLSFVVCSDSHSS